jgi:cell division protein ZapA (FtsZ GTPase activity inhibitor)
VAKLVDETMTRLRDRTGAVDSLDLAIMAALTLARDLVTERANRSEVALESDRISILVERIEACLAEQPEREHP